MCVCLWAVRRNTWHIGPHRTQSHPTEPCSLWAFVDQPLVYRPSSFLAKQSKVTVYSPVRWPSIAQQENSKAALLRLNRLSHRVQETADAIIATSRLGVNPWMDEKLVASLPSSRQGRHCLSGDFRQTRGWTLRVKLSTFKWWRGARNTTPLCTSSTDAISERLLYSPRNDGKTPPNLELRSDATSRGDRVRSTIYTAANDSMIARPVFRSFPRVCQFGAD